MVYDDGLSVYPPAAAGSPVTNVTDGNASAAEPGKHVGRKYVVDYANVLVRIKNSVVVYRDTARLLTAVLKSEQSEVNRLRDRRIFLAENAENAALFSYFSPIITV